MRDTSIGYEMYLHNFFFFLPAMLSVVLCATNLVHAQTRVGEAVLIQNEVVRVAASAATQINVGDGMLRDETVRTGAGSAARFVMADSTNLSLGPTATLKLDRTVFNDEHSYREVAIRLTTGAFRFVTGHSEKPAYRIATPIATIGVRGTTLDILSERGRSVVVLQDGASTVCTLGFQCVQLTQLGHTAIITSTGGKTTIIKTSTPPWTFAATCTASPGLCSVTQYADASPTKAPGAPLSYRWAGFSAGVAVGFGWGNSKQTDSGIPCGFFGTCGGSGSNSSSSSSGSSSGGSSSSSGSGSSSSGGGALSADGSYSPSGGIFGGTLGYDWQQAHWVVGIEGDYSWTGLDGKSATCGASSPLPHACGTRLDSLGSLRGRVGYALGPTGNWLPYLTGGVAAGEVYAWDALLPASGDAFQVGWTVGAGLQSALAQNWSVKIEYLYVDLGSQKFNVVPGVPENATFKASIFRAGLAYQFH
jgi:opacity protein-like surface antigen